MPFGFGLPGGAAPDPNDPAQVQRFLSQLQQLFAGGGDGPVNWDLAREVALSTLTGQTAGVGGAFGFAIPGGGTETTGGGATAPGSPAVTPAQRDQVREALRLADLWLEPVSTLPSGIGTAHAWTRAEWITNTLPVWRKLCDPVAGHMVGAMGELVPEEMRGQLGPMQSMMATLGGALFGGQLGQALGSLAAEVLSAGDIGLPLGPASTAALVPANIEEYGQGLEIDSGEVLLYVALREAAHQRLFGHVPWLRGHVLGGVETYAAGIRVNREAVEEAGRGEAEGQRGEGGTVEGADREGQPQEAVVAGEVQGDDRPEHGQAQRRPGEGAAEDVDHHQAALAGGGVGEGVVARHAAIIVDPDDLDMMRVQALRVRPGLAAGAFAQRDEQLAVARKDQA